MKLNENISAASVSFAKPASLKSFVSKDIKICSCEPNLYHLNVGFVSIDIKQGAEKRRISVVLINLIFPRHFFLQLFYHVLKTIKNNNHPI